MNFKKLVSPFLIAGTLMAAQPTPPANAGLIFLPLGVGVFLLVVGVIYNDPLYVILDADGSVNQDQLVTSLAKSFPAIDQDRDVLQNLAGAIRAKAASATPDSSGKLSVSLDANQVRAILAPTGLADTSPAAAEQIVAALQ